MSTTRTARKMAEQIRIQKTPIWVLVAHRGGAFIFSTPSVLSESARVNPRLGGGEILELVERIDHPEGRLKNRDLVSDEPGRVMGRVSSERHAYAVQTDASRVVAEHFARVLAEKLRIARTQNRFRKVVLVAESRFLGMLRSMLDRPTAVRVAMTVEKEWAWETLPEIRRHLEPVIGKVQAGLALERRSS